MVKSPGCGFHKQAALLNTLKRKYFMTAPHQWAAPGYTLTASLLFSSVHVSPVWASVHTDSFLSLTPESWSQENHQDRVNHLGGWVSAKESSITGPQLRAAQLWSTSSPARPLTSLSSLSGRLGPSAWRCVCGDDLITLFSQTADTGWGVTRRRGWEQRGESLLV